MTSFVQDHNTNSANSQLAKFNNKRQFIGNATYVHSY